MRPIATDTNDFPRLRRENCIYVDKTEYVHRLVSQPGSRLFFMSWPRRFGKSLTLSVLKALFSGRRELFEELFIAEKTDWNWNETYPIIRFEFNDVTTPSLAVASGKTVTIGSTVNVKVSAADGIRPNGGTHTLTSGMNFTGKTVNIVDRPDWVQSVEIDASGNLVAMVKHNGLIISFR